MSNESGPSSHEHLDINISKIDVSAKLTEWDLERFLPAFQREEIDEFSFMNASPEMVEKKLIPVVGPYTKFISEREKLKKTLKEQSDSLKAPETVEESVVGDNINIGDEGIISADRQISKRPSTSAEFQQPEKRFKRGAENKVLSILQNCADGRTLLKWSKDKILQDPQKLANIIIASLVEDSFTVITKEIFIDLTSQIIEIFPAEDPIIYYKQPIPKCPARKDSKYVEADGKLYIRYRNELKRLRILERSLKGHLTDELDVDSASEPDVAVRDSLNWLKHNKDPREDVNFHWKITSRARYNDFVRNEPSTMNTYFQTYNVLKQSWGHTLINIDFEELYNKKSTDLFVEWTPFFERFYKTAVDRNLKKAKELVNLLNEDIPEYIKILVQILLLPYIFPPHSSTTNKKGKQKYYHKPTTSECQSSIIVHAKTVEDIDVIHQNKVDDALKKLMTVQPYIVAVGRSLKEIVNYCVILDSVRWEFDSPLKAFQVFFQIYHVMCGEYPFDCKHILYVIQKNLFKLDTEHDKYGSDVRLRLAKLRELETLIDATTPGRGAA